MQQGGVPVGDYFAILRRRKMQMLIPTIVLILVSIGVAVSIPPTYLSKAMILIEQQEIPTDLVRSTITTYVDQRLEIVTTRAMRVATLKTLIEKHNLYPEIVANEGIEAAVREFRNNFDMTRISGTVIDPRNNRPLQVTAAFTLSFKSADPTTARDVVNSLVDLYLEENAMLRREGTAETSTFLRAESQRLGKEVSELETKLAMFKEQYPQRLPEYTEANIQMMDRAENEMNETKRQIQAVRERQIFLQSQLAQLDPYSGQTAGAASRLVELQAEYAAAAARYSSSHPDLVRMKKEIANLKREVGGAGVAAAGASELASVRDQLADARRRYSEDHPDVKRLKRSVTALEQTLQSSTISPVGSRPTNPDNPAYVQILAQLEAAGTELASLSGRLEDLKLKYETFSERIYQAPQIEREYLALARDYDNAIKEYQEIRSKERDAQLAVELERDLKGERFSLVEPPNLPKSSVGPNPLAIVLVGTVFSFGGGIGTVAITEFLDRTVQSAKQVMTILGAPPLVGIPYIRNSEDIRRHRRNVLLAVFALIIGSVVFGALYVHHKGNPLPEILSSFADQS